jgi:hypothetical protein
MKMDFLPGSGRKTMELLITASPIASSDERLALLIIEDITEISTLKSIIPMCMKCRKIRNDEQYWQSVEQYFHEHIGVDFSHGICPECVDEFYPEFRRRTSSIETDDRLESSSASAMKGFATGRYFSVGSRWPSQCGLRTSLCKLNHCQPQNSGACFFPGGVGASQPGMAVKPNRGESWHT